MEDLRVVKLREELVCPEQETARYTLYLSNIDQLLLKFPVTTLLFYDPPVREMTSEDLYQSIKQALARILVPYNFMAGRLKPRPGDEHQRFDIDCNRAGVVLVLAESKLRLAEVGDVREQTPAFRALVSQPTQPITPPLPLARLQLTYFACGAVCMAFTLDHSLHDGISAATFLLHFAAAARAHPPPAVQPDRTFLRPRDPPTVQYDHPEYGSPGSAAPSGQTHVLHVSPAALRSLKEAVAASGAPARVTTFEALAAHTWRARAMATVTGGVHQAAVLFAVDVRRRLAPPAPEGFAGNAVIPAAVAPLQLADLAGPAGLGLCAARIRAAAQRIDDAYVRSSVDFSELARGPLRYGGICSGYSGADAGPGGGSVCLSAWWRLPLYDVDFGWGRPIYVRPLMHDLSVLGEYVLFVAGGSHADDGIDVYVTLEPRFMATFEQIFTSLL